MGRDALLDMYLKDVSGFKVLTRESECELARKLRAGDKSARQDMIQCNLRLVVSVARQYENQGMQILDVIEEGNIGLMRAVERFDPDMECRFSTYAVHWIKQGIRRALLEKVKNIRVPAYMAELVARWKKLVREQPHITDVEEIVKALKLPKENIKLIQRIMRTAQINGTNLDTEDVSELSGFFEDDHIECDPEAVVGGREDITLLQQRLSQLTKREADILRYRYGMDQFPVLTLEEIGTIFDLTRERVRQIEAKAMKRLRDMIPVETVL
ncbi:MAG: RNA polymerase sigma factor RpoD/SigA [Planctomycetes bacterium]|jgi:RNA polymerase primary sigma factor|nr:RNA polymerase sigma factor RpoD/SigA [Planctomycetota bacterium]